MSQEEKTNDGRASHKNDCFCLSFARPRGRPTVLFWFLNSDRSRRDDATRPV